MVVVVMVVVVVVMVCVCVCVCVCVSCVMREERWTGDEEGDEEVQAGEKGDEEIEHDNALKTLQFMKASTMIHAHQYEVVDHVDAHDRLDRPHSSPSHRKPRSREAEKPRSRKPLLLLRSRDSNPGRSSRSTGC